MSYVRVYVQMMDYPSKRDLDFAFNLSDSLLREGLAPVDLPDRTAGRAQMLCTPADVIRRTFKTRDDISDDIVAEIRRQVREALDQHDTVMGYTQKQQQSFRRP
jgi:hypothetical protein